MTRLDPLGQVEVLLVIVILSCRTTLFGIDAASCFTGPFPWIITFEGVLAFVILGLVLEGLDALEQELDALAVA